MLPGDPTMGDLPDDFLPREGFDGPEHETIDIGSMSHEELMDFAASSMQADPLAEFYQNPPGVAPGRQAYITGLLPPSAS